VALSLDAGAGSGGRWPMAPLLDRWSGSVSRNDDVDVRRSRWQRRPEA